MSITSFVIKKPIPLAPYHYIGDNIISVNNWPNSGTTGSASDLVTYETGTRSVLTGINGHKAMRFTSSNAASMYTSISSMQNPTTIIMVIRGNLTPSYLNNTYWSIGSEAGSYLVPIHFQHNLGATQFSVNGGGTAIIGVGNVSIYAFPKDTWMVITFRYNNSLWFNGNRSANVRKNGVSIGSGTGTPNLTSSSTTRIRLGRAFAGTTDGNRDFAEFIYYQQVLDDATCLSIENNLKTKYGIV